MMENCWSGMLTPCLLSTFMLAPIAYVDCATLHSSSPKPTTPGSWKAAMSTGAYLGTAVAQHRQRDVCVRGQDDRIVCGLIASIRGEHHAPTVIVSGLDRPNADACPRVLQLCLHIPFVSVISPFPAPFVSPHAKAIPACQQQILVVRPTLWQGTRLLDQLQLPHDRIWVESQLDYDRRQGDMQVAPPEQRQSGDSCGVVRISITGCMMAGPCLR